MMKALLVLLLALNIFASDVDDQTDQPAPKPQPCLILSEEKLIGLESMPENELVLISNKCSYADFTKQLKEVLSTALLGENNGKLQLSLKDEKINVIMDTLATDHEGSASFSFEDTKKIEDFYSSTQADTLKQSGSFAAIEKDNSNDFYLVLFYNATKDKLIIIYKRLTAVPQNDEPAPVPPSDENQDEETQLELDLNL